jgi:hypothetical protein
MVEQEPKLALRRSQLHFRASVAVHEMQRKGRYLQHPTQFVVRQLSAVCKCSGGSGSSVRVRIISGGISLFYVSIGGIAISSSK